MTRFHRLLLAAFLAVGCVGSFSLPRPAHAQIVPSEPDTERRMRYTATAQTGPFSVGFDIYGDATDFQHWIEVYVNGVQLSQSGNWTLSSPSGSLAVLGRPITDATITFTAAQTGTIDIVGGRRPRRTAQFAENKPVTAHDLNLVFTDLWMTLRERWDRIPRMPIAPPGETACPNGLVLPGASARANLFFGFDSSGCPIASTGQAGPTGPTGPAGSNGTNGSNGLDGSDPGYRYAFDSSTSMANPGAGKYRLDNASPASAVNIAVSAQTGESGNPNLLSTLQTWDGSTSTAIRGYVLIKKIGAPQNFISAIITGAKTDNTTWVQFPITVVTVAGTISNTDNVSVQFARTGDKGNSGAGTGNVVGPGTNSDNFIPQWTGINSLTLKNGLAVSAFGTSVLNGASKTAHGIVIGNGTSDPATTAVMTDGQDLVGQTGADPLPKTMSGDCTRAASGAITCTKTNGVSFATSATTDATNASNIASGTLAAARAGASAGNHSALIDIGGTSTWKVIPDCQDVTGNHINYTQSTDAFSCGNSGAGGATLTTIDGFRLTLSTGVPILSAPVSGAVSIFVTPLTGNQIALYNGSWTVLSCAEFSVATTNSQSGTSTNGSTTLVVTDSSQLIGGMKITGTGIAASSTISSVTDATHIVMNNAATGSGTNTMTFKVPADTGLDVFAQNSSGSCKAFFTARVAILTPPTFGAQDGVVTKNGDATQRYIGTVATSATDGQVDWILTGQRRYRLFNFYNRQFLSNTEGFSSSGTYFGLLGLTRGTADVMGAGGNTGTTFADAAPTISSGGAGGRGGRSIKNFTPADIGGSISVTVGGPGVTSSFGSLATATSGANGTNGASLAAGTPGSDGTGASGDFNLTGGGAPGGSTGGVHLDPGGGGAATSQGGVSGNVTVRELVAY